MPELQHAIRMLSYRMRRYPLWIVVMITAIPLYSFGLWLVRNCPWTSSFEHNSYLFRIDDRLWGRHVEYIPQRHFSYRWNSAHDSNCQEFLFDTEKETATHIKTLGLLKSGHNPVLLKDKTLLYRANNDVEARIFDPRSNSTKTIWLPFEYGVIVDGNFFAFTNDNELLTVDILKATHQKRTKLLFEHEFREVYRAPHLLLSLGIANAANQIIDSIRKNSLIVNAAMSIFEEYGLSLYFSAEISWHLLSLYKVDEEGAHWQSSWLASYDDYFNPDGTTQGYIESRSLDGERIEIRHVDDPETVIVHPLTIGAADGSQSKPGALTFGGLLYQFGDLRGVLVEPGRPGKHLAVSPAEYWLTGLPDKSGRLYGIVKSKFLSSAGCFSDTFEIRNRETTEIVLTWTQNRKPVGTWPHAFDDTSRSLFLTDDLHRILKIDTESDTVIDEFDPYDGWRRLLVLLGLCLAAWNILLTLACLQLHVPRMVQVCALSIPLWSLMAIRQSEIGAPSFSERLSAQCIVALTTLIILSCVAPIWKSSLTKLALLLPLVFVLLGTAVLYVKLQQDNLSPIESVVAIGIGCCVLVAMGYLIFLLTKLARMLKLKRKWSASILSCLFWLALSCLTLALMKETVAKTSLTELKSWVGVFHILTYPTLAVSLWLILENCHVRLLNKLVLGMACITVVTALRTVVVAPHLSTNDYVWQLREELFYACCATLPISILSCAFFLRLPRWLRHGAKRWLAIRSSSTILSSR